MVLAIQADVVAALRRELTADEAEWVEDLIDEASDMVIGYLGADPTTDDDVPSPVTRVVARMVARVFKQEASSTVTPGVSQVGVTAGPFSEQRSYREGFGSGSPWLESTDKVRLRRYRSVSSISSIPLSGEQTGKYRRFT